MKPELVFVQVLVGPGFAVLATGAGTAVGGLALDAGAAGVGCGAGLVPGTGFNVIAPGGGAD